jgi:hypothetical protein
LTIGYDDQSCIYPPFSGIFGNSSRKDRPVYPYGGAREDEDYRDKFE